MDIAYRLPLIQYYKFTEMRNLSGMNGVKLKSGFKLP